MTALDDWLARLEEDPGLPLRGVFSEWLEDRADPLWYAYRWCYRHGRRPARRTPRANLKLPFCWYGLNARYYVNRHPVEFKDYQEQHRLATLPVTVRVHFLNQAALLAFPTDRAAMLALAEALAAGQRELGL